MSGRIQTRRATWHVSWDGFWGIQIMVVSKITHVVRVFGDSAILILRERPVPLRARFPAIRTARKKEALGLLRLSPALWAFLSNEQFYLFFLSLPCTLI